MGAHGVKMTVPCHKYNIHHGFLEGTSGRACTAAQGLLNRAIPDLGDKKLDGCVQECQRGPKVSEQNTTPSSGTCDKCQNHLPCMEKIKQLSTAGFPKDPDAERPPTMD